MLTLGAASPKADGRLSITWTAQEIMNYTNKKYTSSTWNHTQSTKRRCPSDDSRWYVIRKPLSIHAWLHSTNTHGFLGQRFKLTCLFITSIGEPRGHVLWAWPISELVWPCKRPSKHLEGHPLYLVWSNTLYFLYSLPSPKPGIREFGFRNLWAIRRKITGS